MSRRTAAWGAWSLWALDLLTVGALLVVGGGDDGGGWTLASGALFIVVFASTGALVASRVPRNPVGWLLCLAALAFSVGALCEEVLARAGQTPDPGPVVLVAGWLQLVVWMLGIGPAATFLLLLFPDGHLPSPRWRPVAWVAAAALAATLLGSALVPGSIDGTAMDNPLGVPVALAGAARTLETVGLVLLLACTVLSGASLVARFRAAGTHERHQLQWLAYSVPVVLLGWTAAIVLGVVLDREAGVEASNALVTGSLAAVPVSIGVAMLRHRLYDMELVIKRTIVYGAVTAVLVGTYLVLVLLLQNLLRPVAGESDLAVAASTLAVAALFRPLRATIQRGVDRRFSRSRYDAARTVEHFVRRLRQEIDLQTTSADLRGVVRETMQPSHVSLWLRSGR